VYDNKGGILQPCKITAVPSGDKCIWNLTSSDNMESSDSDFDFIDNIRGNGSRDTDTNSDLDASDIDAAV